MTNNNRTATVRHRHGEKQPPVPTFIQYSLSWNKEEYHKGLFLCGLSKVISMVARLLRFSPKTLDHKEFFKYIPQ
nr:MAG TPA: hypothetical protein [Caudoviricetes sp.]